MSQNKGVIFVSVMLLISIILSSMSTSCIKIARGSDETPGKSSHKMLKWKAQPTIKEPMVADITGQDVLLGNFDNHQFEIKIPGNAFAQSARVTVVNSKKPQPVPSTEFIPIGVPIEINADKQNTYLKELATITFKLDKSAITSNPNPSVYWVAHYAGSAWQYIKPYEVNLEKGTISVQVTHFSELGLGIITDAMRIDEYANRKAMEKFVEDKASEMTREALGGFAEKVLDKIGVTDEKKKELVNDVITDPAYTELIQSVRKGETDKFTKQLGSLLQKNISTILTKKGLDEVWLGTIQIKGPFAAALEHADDIKQFVEAAGAVAGGDYQGAAEKMGEWVAGKSPVASLFLTARDKGIQLANDLNNKFFEKAYRDYAANTANMTPEEKKAYFDTEEFRTFVGGPSTLKDVLRKLEYRFRETGSSQPEESAKKYLMEHFDIRQQQEKAIAQTQKEINELIAIFGKAGETDSTIEDFLNPWRDDGFLGRRYKANAPEDRLNELLEIVETIKRDTGTTKIGGDRGPGVFQEYDLVYLATELIKARKNGKAADYRSAVYLEMIKDYTFRIIAPPVIIVGKGATKTNYTFKAEGRQIPVIATYKWFLRYGGKEKSLPDTTDGTIGVTFKTAGKYTLQCIAVFPGRPIGPQEVEQIKKVATLTFAIPELSAKIKVTVKDKMTGNPIPAANVQVSLLPDGLRMPPSVTDINGAATFGNIPAGQYRIIAKAQGYSQADGKLTIDPAKKQEYSGTIWLQKETTVAIEPSELTGEPNKRYTFTAKVTSPPTKAQYEWDFGDGTPVKRIENNTISHIYSKEGTFNLTVRLFDDPTAGMFGEAKAKASIKAGIKDQKEPWEWYDSYSGTMIITNTKQYTRKVSIRDAKGRFHFEEFKESITCKASGPVDIRLFRDDKSNPGRFKSIDGELMITTGTYPVTYSITYSIYDGNKSEEGYKCNPVEKATTDRSGYEDQIFEWIFFNQRENVRKQRENVRGTEGVSLIGNITGDGQFKLWIIRPYGYVGQKDVYYYIGEWRYDETRISGSYSDSQEKALSFSSNLNRVVITKP